MTMKVYLDGKEIEIDRPTLGGAVAAGCQIAEAAGRIVVEATVDGEPISAEQLAAAEGDVPTPNVSELRLTSAEPRSLVLMTFLDVADALAAAKDEQAAAAELIQVGKLDEGLGRLGGALSVWEQARQAVANGCSLLRIPLETPVSGGEGSSPPPSTIAGRADVLATSLGEVKRSIEAGDWTGLADALLYDMESQAKSWREMLNELASIVRSTGHTPGPPRDH